MKKVIEEQVSFSDDSEYDRLRKFLVSNGVSLKTIQNDQIMVDWLIGIFIKKETEAKNKERLRNAYFPNRDGLELEIRVTLLEQRLKNVEGNIEFSIVEEEND